MHRRSYTLVAIALIVPASASAQPPAGDPLTAAMRRHYEGVSRNAREAAEKMPEVPPSTERIQKPPVPAKMTVRGPTRG